MRDDLHNSVLVNKPVDDLDSLVDQFNTTLRTIFDKHAPMKSRTLTNKRENPWYNNEIHEQRKLRRKLTRIWRKTKSSTDKEKMISQRDLVHNMIHTAKSTFYQHAIIKAGTDSKTLFQITSELLSDRKVNPMPDAPLETNPNDFNAFFVENINRLKERFDDSSDYKTYDCNSIVTRFHEFLPIDLDQTRKLIESAPNKSCDLDPIPTVIFKSFIDTIAPVVQKIINTSLDTGTVPSAYKSATVKPLLKKPGLETLHKNYRPVSNLSFISKLIEQTVINQLEKHSEMNGLGDDLQSAYRPDHSTETALLHIVDDLLIAMDNRNAVCLGMLDLSAAFDTINHDIMIERLVTSQGIDAPAIDWFDSYLRGRTQRVVVENHMSDPIMVEDGAVQGSKIGCRLYKKYVEPLGKLLKQSNCANHGYADDNTIWIIVNPRSESSVHLGLQLLEHTIEDVRTWMYANKLCPNDSKTLNIVTQKICHNAP